MPARAETQLTGNKLGSADQVLETCGELEGELTALQVAYEQFFLGLERRPPAKEHEALKKKVQALKRQIVRSVVAKVRVANLATRLSTYERLWERTLKEIESGTYRRDLFKAKLHKNRKDVRKDQQKKDEKGPASPVDELEIDEDLDLSDLDAPQPPAPPAPPPAPEPPRPSAPPAGALAPRPSAPPPKPLITAAIPPGAAAASKVSGAFPAVRPVSGGQPAMSPPGPATGSRPAVTAQGAKATGSQPAVSPPGARPVTGAQPAVSPPGARPVSGGQPAVRAATGSHPAARPVSGGQPAVRSATGSHPAASSTTGTALRPVTTGSQPAHSPAGRSGGAGDGLSEQKIKAIYDAYVMAKRRCGEDTSKLSLKSVSDTLRKQVPELMKQHKARSVEFKVVIKDGKAVLRALPKE